MKRAVRLEGGGWTLVELLLVVAITGTLSALALPAYQQTVERAKIVRAVGDMAALQIDLATFQAGADSLPSSLAGIDRADLLDPWGRPYQYLVIPAKAHGHPEGARKDRFLVPLNSDYDLYSMGKDGETEAPLTAKGSHDDVIRANDGAYIGLASHF